MTATFRLLGGVMAGGGMLMSYRSLESVHQGQTVFIAYKQSTVLYDLTMNVFSLLKDMERKSPTGVKRAIIARLIAYPLPFALQVLHYKLDANQYPLTRRVVDTLCNHIEHVALAIDVVVCALFTYYVAPYFGVGTLIGLSIEVLNEKKMLPAKIKDLWEKAWLCLAFSRLLKPAIFNDNDLWELGHFACEMTTFLWEHYLSDSFPKPEAKPQAYHEIQPRIHWPHLEENPNLLCKGAHHLDIEEVMNSLMEQVEWTDENLTALTALLGQDSIFLVSNIVPNRKNAIAYFKTNGKQIADQIGNMAIKKGDSYIRYDILQGMMRSILKSIQDEMQKDETRQNALADLFQLAISGGDYCGGGKSETIENIYKRRVINGKDIPLRVKTLHILSSLRKSWFDQFYAKVTQVTYRLPKGIFDPSDIHFYNICLFYFDKSFKLHSEALKNDMNITETAFCSRFYRLLLSTILDYTFWIYAARSPEWYSTDALLDQFAATCGDGLPLAELNKWWIEWVEKQNYTEDQEEKITNEIYQDKIFGQPLFIEKDKKKIPNPQPLKRMFFEMGILT